jgi:hypothetical protein
MFIINYYSQTYGSPVTTPAPLAEPVAKPPSVPECFRLVNLFLAGRNPRTLAACQADLEDFRCFLEASSVPAPTVGKAVE